MTGDLSVVLASNRGPVSFVRTSEGFEIVRGAGGLAGALDPVARRLGADAVWIAAATSDADRAALRAGAADGLENQLGYPVYLLDIDEDTYARYYDEVSNRMLWFANHCLWDELDIPPFGEKEAAAWRDAYVPVNERFAAAILETADPGSVVLLQDYHLSVAPGVLRQARPEQQIFHFTHSSFCAAGLERLPESMATGVVEGMLGADLVGFHTRAWAEEFLTACEMLGHRVNREEGRVDRGERTTWVRSYPISVDAGELRKRAAAIAAQSWVDRFSASAEILIVRADRTEPSKNILRGFEAFGTLLDRREDLQGKTRFIACLYPSRQSMGEYRSYADLIERTAAEINSRHPGSIDLYMEDDFDRTLGALRVYDLLLVNSIMDGMNLVSKEGSVINERAGVIVLSTRAGSYEELGDQVFEIADPLDVEETAAAMESALALSPAERTSRAEELRARVEGRTPEDWIETQLDDLVALREKGEPVTPPTRATG
ncbi:MAG: alpha,alpha-trehalose-phosphate synthase (UDP-forming) [Actinomycetota bacterium]